MICIACNGDRWRHRLVPHPGIPGKMVTVTKVCSVCQGTGHVNVLNQTSGKDKAAQEEHRED